MPGWAREIDCDGWAQVALFLPAAFLVAFFAGKRPPDQVS